METAGVKRRLTCILAADAVGFSGQMGQDEEGTMRVLAAHRAVMDGIIEFHGGRIFGTAGDSVLAEFGSAVEAVRCAVEIQAALKTRNNALPQDRRMLFRIGINLGDVMVKNDDLLGDGVNVAARLEGVAEPGGICISSSVYDQITGKLDLGFLDIGEQQLKNIPRLVRVFRISGSGGPTQVTLSPPPESRMPGALKLALAALLALAIAAGVAWQTGWIKPAGQAAALPQASASPAPAATAPDSAAAIQAQKLQAEAELARLQLELEANRAAKARAEAEAQAAKVRAEAEVQAAKVRAQAEADAARLRAQAEAAARAREERARAQQAAAPAPPAPAPVAAATPVSAPAPAPANPAGVFDGRWLVTVACDAAGIGSRYSVRLIAEVKDNHLRGEHKEEGTPGWLQVEGKINPDGSAMLLVRGLTNDPKYTINAVAKGSPYSYSVAATFRDAHGTGQRLGKRKCELIFDRQ